MKNLHILPTDKPSRLHLGNSGLVLCDLKHNSNTINAQHIYIIKVTKDFFWDFGVRYYKIILTTDQDLIKDGVQAIDDEFLEWFVKNPSCEEVEVEKQIGCIDLDAVCDFGEISCPNAPDCLKNKYKIIIPKEEPKQETLEEAAKGYSERHQDVSGNLGKYLVSAVFQDGAKWQDEVTGQIAIEFLEWCNSPVFRPEVVLGFTKRVVPQYPDYKTYTVVTEAGQPALPKGKFLTTRELFQEFLKQRQ